MRLLLLILFFLFGLTSQAQQLFSGHILDEKNLPLPSAKLYVKNDASQRTVADANGYFEMRLMPGEYYIVVTFLGYDTREIYLGMGDDPIIREIQLFPTQIKDLESVDVTAKKSNPGRDIMLNVIKRRDEINPWNYPHITEVYTRATEQLSETEKAQEKEKKKVEKQKEKEEAEKEKKKEEKKEIETTEENHDILEDPFAEEKAKQQKEEARITNSMNLVEVYLTRNFAPPLDVKEIRNAYEVRGNKQNLYYITTVKSNFNFFQNLLHLDDLHHTPVSSPISGPGILSYKYRLEDQYMENGQKIHKIKIIPRNTATTTLLGYIWVIDSIWMVQKLELTMEKGNLIIYDNFTITQEYENWGDTLNVLVSQKLQYGVKYGSNISTSVTNSQFKKYNFQPAFDKKFFNNELSVTEEDAYEKDSAFWSDKRGISLTPEEQKYILLKDSIETAHNKKEYLDSVDAIFNKITALKVLVMGIDHRNRDKKVQWSLSSVASTIEPIFIAGPRISPGFYYFKKWENEKFLVSNTDLGVGVLNGDLKGGSWISYRYDPFRFGTIGGGAWHQFDVVRSFDAISQIYKRSNFIEKTSMQLFHFGELFNGFYMTTTFDFAERRDVNEYKFVTLFDNALPNEDPTEFPTYQALIGKLRFEYTPEQKYMREKKRKVVLGSRWPTLYGEYERGVPKAFGSDVDFEYLSFGLTQSFKIKTLGTTNYNVKSGKFLSSKVLYDADFKFHRRSDPIWFSNPLHSFQGLDSSLPSRKIFFETHFIHHDNGAIINKIPFMKKTGIGLVFGGGYLYVPEFNWQHAEILAGLERNFKFSKRKLRIGVYGVLSDGNQIQPRTDFKVSFALLDLRDMQFNF
jgi:Family of unknown function (DUF5686)/CarboxypepD_reg-like domain